MGEPSARRTMKSSRVEFKSKATWKREFKHPWREAGPPNHHDDKVDSDREEVGGRAVSAEDDEVVDVLVRELDALFALEERERNPTD